MIRLNYGYKDKYLLLSRWLPTAQEQSLFFEYEVESYLSYTVNVWNDYAAKLCAVFQILIIGDDKSPNIGKK